MGPATYLTYPRVKAGSTYAHAADVRKPSSFTMMKVGHLGHAATQGVFLPPL